MPAMPIALVTDRARALLKPRVMTRGLELLAADDPHAERIWQSLEAHARPSYFLSWGFIRHWLDAVPADERPSLAVICDRGEPAAAFLLARRHVRHHLGRETRALYFNATGSPAHDQLALEHNGLLAAPGTRRSLAALVDLLPAGWDELHLPAVDRYAFDDLGAAPLAAQYRVRIVREASAPYVDLDLVRTVAGGYDALLPANTRTQLARSRTLIGGIDLEIARDEPHALAIYDELVRLSVRRWALRGGRGIFADPRFEQFHRRLIQRRLAHGEIQLVRIKAGNTTLGCFYNFVYRGRVSFYRCGLAPLGDPQIKAGYLCHAAAIEYNALAGHAFYDLHGGRAAYKESLATGAHRLIWLRVRRPFARFSLEDAVRRWYERIAGDRAALAPA